MCSLMVIARDAKLSIHVGFRENPIGIVSFLICVNFLELSAGKGGG
jgi:hypothetical protein